MTDVIRIAGSQFPKASTAATTYTPIAGSTALNPDGFPVGTPVRQSQDQDHTAIPANANTQARSLALGIASTPGVSGIVTNVVTHGPVTLTEAEWDDITGDTGGLVRGAPYYLGLVEGKLTATKPVEVGTFVVQVGIATSPKDLFVQIFPGIEILGPS